MDKRSIVQAVYKLALAGEQAGFSLEQMIELLKSGITVPTLLLLIEVRLICQGRTASSPTTHSSGRVM
jgi:hypothetical protein